MLVAIEVIQQYVNIDNVSYYTDSMTALCWILNDYQEYKQFVEERAVKIRKLSENWKHVKGTENPADLTSRGLFATQLKDNLLWTKGPDWLMLSPEKWPVKERDVEHTDESIKEMRVEDQKKVEFTCASIALNCHEVIDVDRFSSFRKLLRVTAYVRRFIHNTRYPEKKIAPGEPNPVELKEAEIMWIRTMQEDLKRDPKYSNLERQLSIYEDEEGILRSRGRLEKSELIHNQKHPVVLPPRHPVVPLIIWDAHDKVLHSGVNDTMAFIRETFWIPRLRQLTRALLHKCVICRWIEGKSYSPPPFPPLPKSRVVFEEPFSTTGVDYAGPLFVKTIEMQSAKSKAYILLFTCTTSRAVHLELTPDLRSSACVRGLKRFIARRGTPQRIISDNAKTFKAAETRQFLADRGISWQFNVPRAPWMGGFFERMVQSTKRCLKKILKNSSLTYEELETVLIEVENIINNRPLTYIDTETTEQVLTPNHLIFGRSLPIANQLFTSQKSKGVKEANFRKRVLYRQKLLKDFVKRWETEYLAGLRASQKIPKTNNIRMPNAGDVVLVHGNSPRLTWKLGRIEKLHSSDDGVVRSASVRIGGKSGLIERPIKLLYPLEEDIDKKVESDETENDHQIVIPENNTDSHVDINAAEDVEPRTSVVSNEPTTVQRPRRAAAIRGEQQRKRVQSL